MRVAGEAVTNRPAPGTSNITAATVTDLDDFARSLTCYSRNPAKQLKAAYGDRYPGSNQRWLDQQSERESAERWQLRARAWKLYRRVHGEPCAAELRSKKLQAERWARIKATGQGSA